MKITDKEIIADNGMAVRRRGTLDYGTRITLLPNETSADFEELTASDAQADAEVNSTEAREAMAEVERQAAEHFADARANENANDESAD